MISGTRGAPSIGRSLTHVTIVGSKDGFLSGVLTNRVNTRILYCIWTPLQPNPLLLRRAGPKNLLRRGFASIPGT